MNEAQSEVNINEIVEESLKDIKMDQSMSQQKEDNMQTAKLVEESLAPETPGISSLAKDTKVIRAVEQSTDETTPNKAIDQAWSQGIEDNVI